MFEEVFTKELNVPKMSGETIEIDGSIGKIIFGGENMTEEKAQKEYDKFERIDANFWEYNRATYYTYSNEPPLEQ